METENAKMLDLEALKTLLPRKVFAKGEVLNSPEGVFMTDHRRGDTLKWVAETGQIGDWAIYVDWAEKSYEQVLRNGQKMYDLRNIQKLVPCTEEALNNYRY